MRAIRLKPDYTDAYINRGLMKYHMGQSESGIADFNEAIRLKSDDAEVYTNRGMVKFSLRQI